MAGSARSFPRKSLMFFLCGGDGEAYALQIADCVTAKFRQSFSGLVHRIED